MSLLAHADLLKTHLEADEDLAGVKVHVDRMFDVRKLAAAELGKKTSGAFLAISLAGWTPINPDGTTEYWATLNYELSLATSPHILETLGMPTFDALLRLIVVSIHGWQPASMGAIQCDERWRVGGGNYVPDDSFLVYLFPASITEEFSNPITIPT